MLNGNFKLRSGKTSTQYFDKYRFESDPRMLAAISEHWQKNLPANFDILAGLELGGVPLATALSLTIKKPLLFVRKKAKDYGTCQIAEGLDFRNQKLLIVEDVITTGGQVFESTEILRSQGAKVTDVICVIDRGENTESLFMKENLRLHALFKMEELLLYK